MSKILAHLISILGKRRESARYGQKRVYWPEGSTPAEAVPFREIEVAGRIRPWRWLPHPERLGLAREAVSSLGANSFQAAVSFMIGKASAEPLSQFELDEIEALARAEILSLRAVTVF
jgi:hypothetical protein